MTIRECYEALEGAHIGAKVRAINTLSKMDTESARDMLLSCANNPKERPYIRYYAKRSAEPDLSVKRQESPVATCTQDSLNRKFQKRLFGIRLLMSVSFITLAVLTFLYIDYGSLSEALGDQEIESVNVNWSKEKPSNNILKSGQINPYKLFELADKKYNVDAAVIEFIWFQESSMGRNIGNYRILDVYRIENGDSEKIREWKKRERAAFIKICRKNKLNSRKLFGGRYGEMGPFQFMPSTWLAFGQDGNRDGIANPWDMADAIFTVAYYLSYYGYDKEDFGKIKRAVAFYNQSPKYFNSLKRNAAFFGLDIKDGYFSK